MTMNTRLALVTYRWIIILNASVCWIRWILALRRRCNDLSIRNGLYDWRWLHWWMCGHKVHHLRHNTNRCTDWLWWRSLLQISGGRPWWRLSIDNQNTHKKKNIIIDPIETKNHHKSITIEWYASHLISDTYSWLIATAKKKKITKKITN